MKILHLILLGSYTDGFSYQENLLPKYHKKAGHEVEIITSVLVRDSGGNYADYRGDLEYTDQNGIEVVRIPYRPPKKLSKIFRRYKGLYPALERAKPDIMFIHGCQFADMDIVAKYLGAHPQIRVFVDNHADLNNSARNFFSKNILHKRLWKSRARMIEPFAEKFYGVVPAREDFLKEIYGLPESKCGLLVMGVDDDEAQKALAPGVRAERRREYGASDSDFVIVTGGKIDENKPQVISLMRAVNSLPDKSVRLIVFGSVSDMLRQDFEKSLGDRVEYIGWRSSAEIYSDFAAADLVAFPGLHSVLWEQAAGMGKPCAFKRIKGFEHVDLGGNCVFFENDSEEEYTRVIALAKKNIAAMKKSAEEKGMKAFSYRETAKRAIGQNA